MTAAPKSSTAAPRTPRAKADSKAKTKPKAKAKADIAQEAAAPTAPKPRARKPAAPKTAAPKAAKAAAPKPAKPAAPKTAKAAAPKTAKAAAPKAAKAAAPKPAKPAAPKAAAPKAAAPKASAKAKSKVPSKGTPEQAAALRDLIVAQLDKDKAQDIVVIELAGKSSLADSMVVASGTSARQVAAMADHLVEKLKTQGIVPRSEGMTRADWVLIDAFDVIVHLFRPEVREFYALEKMWQAEMAEDGTAIAAVVTDKA